MIKVRYFGPFALDTGYSRACSDYLECFLEAGVDLDIKPIVDGKVRTLEDRYHNLLPYVNREDVKDPSWPDVVVMHATPAGGELFLEDKELAPPKHIPRILITTWESDPLPSVYVNNLSSIFDQIWVPSRFCKDVFINGGMLENLLKIVPHSYDPNYWKALNTKALRIPEDGSQPCYTFYTILTWCERKNPIGLLKAYLTEFKPDDNVLLRIRTPGYNEQEINELVRGLKLSYLPPVEMLCDYLDEKQLLDLHYKSDCYVTCARSEGWGLGAFEAAILGKPVIATGYSGLKDFLDNYDNGFWLPHFMTPAYTPESNSNSVINVAGLNIKPVTRNDHTGIAGDQEWAEPDLRTLKMYMRDCYNSYLSEEPIFAKTLEEKFSYTKVGAIVKKELEDLLA